MPGHSVAHWRIFVAPKKKTTKKMEWAGGGADVRITLSFLFSAILVVMEGMNVRNKSLVGVPQP